MKLLRWLVPLVSLAAVLTFTWWDVGGTSAGPGPLHPAHARIPELAGEAHCEACHAAGSGIAAAKCNACHTAVGTQQGTGHGVHGSLTDAAMQRCESCHGEHHGDTVALIAPHAFARAGIDDLAHYDHKHVDFQLNGAHLGLACTRCHPHANDVDPPAQARFIGLDQRCTTCHEDAHKGAFGADCAKCHGQSEPFAKAPLFPHDAFPLADAHRRAKCAQCHADGTDRAVEALRQHPQPTRTCAQCHADPHGGSGDAPTALRLAKTADCARCHQATTWDTAKMTPEQHATTGFLLRGEHAKAACRSCHGGPDAQVRWRGPTPALAECAACHDHPHREAVVAAATAVQGPKSGCADCHRDHDTGWKAGTMDAAQHAATGFALAVPHADVACAKCHQGEDRSARFPGRTPAACSSCHADAHKGQFAGKAAFAECTACHAPTAFRPPQFGVTAHAATAFPLTGAHDAVACTACHQKVADGVRRFAGEPSECAQCHTDVHRGAFDRPGRPRTAAGKSGCERCHDTTAFTPVTTGFDHTLWTGYELVGAHTKTECAKCHPPVAATAKAPARRLGPTRGRSCNECHADPHAGQFAAAGVTDCRRCHVAASFQEVHFDHQTQSRFPLDDVHRPLACAKCHTTYQTPQGPLVRYKPLGTTCGDCHKLGIPTGGRK